MAKVSRAEGVVDCITLPGEPYRLRVPEERPQRCLAGGDFTVVPDASRPLSANHPSDNTSCRGTRRALTAAEHGTAVIKLST
jgi:hypothetical protein